MRGIGGMDHDRETPARGQLAITDIDPFIAVVIAAIHAVVALLIEDVRSRGVHGNAMHALAELRIRIRVVLGAHALVARHPGGAAIVGAVAAAGRDGDVHALRIGGIENDGVQAEPAGAGIELAAVRMIVQALIDGPRLAAIA